MVKHYIKMYVPGSFLSDTRVQEIESRDKLPKLDSRVYAYNMFSRESAIVRGEELLGQPKNFSPMYYIGTEMAAQEAIALGNPTAIANIESNGYKRLIRTKSGQLFPLQDGDVVISE